MSRWFLGFIQGVYRFRDDLQRLTVDYIGFRENGNEHGNSNESYYLGLWGLGSLELGGSSLHQQYEILFNSNPERSSWPC